MASCMEDAPLPKRPFILRPSKLSELPEIAKLPEYREYPPLPAYLQVESDPFINFMSSDELNFNFDDYFGIKIPVVIDLKDRSLTENLTRESEQVQTALRLLENGEVIAIPTDTIYGLACDADNIDALKKLYTITGRDRKKPLCISVGRVEDIRRWANLGPVEPGLLEDILPGPTTVVFKRRDRLNKYLNPYEDKIGIRVPDHPFVQLLAREFGGPIALTSASLNNEPGTLSIEELYPFWEHLGAIYDGGRLGYDRTGSTIIDLSVSGQFRVIREGEGVYDTLTKLVKRGFIRFQFARTKL